MLLDAQRNSAWPGLTQGFKGGYSYYQHLHTYFGMSAVMTTAASGGTGVPAFVSTRPLTDTFPCTIQDCTMLLLCCGCCCRHTSSSRRFLLGPWGKTKLPFGSACCARCARTMVQALRLWAHPLWRCYLLAVHIFNTLQWCNSGPSCMQIQGGVVRMRRQDGCKLTTQPLSLTSVARSGMTRE